VNPRDILLAIARRDASSEHAVRLLDAQHRDSLLRNLVRQMKFHRMDPAYAEDVLQNAFFHIARGAHSFRGVSDGEAWNWIMRVVERCCLDEKRRQGRTLRREISLDARLEEHNDAGEHGAQPLPPPLIGDDRSIDETLNLTEKTLLLVHKLSPLKAEVLRHLMDGLDVKEIAEILGRSEAATRQFIYECRITAKRVRDQNR
jgi:RNA polymerase sigma factor (sigma-70 family)